MELLLWNSKGVLMSREIYESSMEIIENLLKDSKYQGILLNLEKLFIKTHISITNIDKEREILWGYYFEKTLITPIEDYENRTLLDLLYDENKLDMNTYSFLKNKTLSVFKVKKVKKEFFTVIDIFNNKEKIDLKFTEEWFGINKGDLIQSYLYYSTEPYLSIYGFIHPKGVDKFILKETKNIIKNKNYDYIDEFLAKLFRKFVNSKRYSRKDSLEIYSIDL